MEYTLIRSKRKTISMEIGREGLIVRAPLKMSNKDIEKFISEHKSWIEKHKAKIESAGNAVPLTEEEIKLLTKRAKAYIPQRAQLYAKLMNVSYGRISIRAQKSRWGSCSSKKNLNFNCLLMLTPIEVIDSVVVHELSHLRHMNHSKEFYEEIYLAFPDYDRWNRWLKENGSAIIARLK